MQRNFKLADERAERRGKLLSVVLFFIVIGVIVFCVWKFREAREEIWIDPGEVVSGRLAPGESKGYGTALSTPTTIFTTDLTKVECFAKVEGVKQSEPFFDWNYGPAEFVISQETVRKKYPSGRLEGVEIMITALSQHEMGYRIEAAPVNTGRR